MSLRSEKRIKIGVDGREFVGRKTGIARLFGEALEEIATLRPAWELVIFGNQNTKPPFHSNNVRLECYPEQMTVWWDQVILTGLLKKHGIDIFLSPYYKIPLMTSCPSINIVHDLIFLTSKSYQHFSLFPKRLFFYLLGFVYARKSNLILTDSFYSKKCIHQIFGISENKIQVVYPGFSKSLQSVHDEKSFEALRERFHIASNYILYVGNFKPHKRVDCLLQAYAILPEAVRKGYSLILTGSYETGAHALVALADKLKISDQVVFTDHQNDAILSSLYKHASLFVFPSSDEGFGLPPLEAMANGTPVVASSAGSIPEVVGSAAVLVPPGDVRTLSEKIQEVLGDEALRKRMIEKGLERSHYFTIEKQSSQMVSWIEGLLRNDGTSPSE